MATTLTVCQLSGEIEKKKDELEAVRSALLRASGWTHNCDIGSMWLWSKEIDGKGVVYMNKETACHLANYFAEMEFTGDEDDA